MKTTFRKIKATKAAGQTGQWISVKDFLPEPDIAVAVLTNTGKATTAECSHKTTRASFVDGRWEIVWYMPIKEQPKSKKGTQPHHATQITHWMPFPASPLQLIETKTQPVETDVA